MQKESNLASVPFFAFESVQTRAERVHRRLLTALLASVAINIVCVTTVARKGF